jgi:hypothetical protein
MLVIFLFKTAPYSWFSSVTYTKYILTQGSGFFNFTLLLCSESNLISNKKMLRKYTGCFRIRYTILKIYCDLTNRNITTQFLTEHLLTLQVFFTSVQYGCDWLCDRHPDDILIHPTVCPRKWHVPELWPNNPVTKPLMFHWHGWYVHIIFHESPKRKVHGCQIGWSRWPWNVAATTCPSFRECLVQVRWSSRELGDISHMTVWRVLHKKLFFWPYKFQLLQELKPNDQPHRRNLCTDMLNCLKQDNLFFDKIVLSDEANFHLSGKVNHHNLIIWESQNRYKVVKVRRKVDRSWLLHSMATQITQSDTHGLFILGIRER